MAGPSNFEFDSSGNLKTTGGGGGGATDVNIAKVNGSAPALNNPLPVELSDGTNALGTGVNPLRVDPTGTTPQPVTVASLPLPSGAATAANQTNGNQVTQVTGTVPLPTGAATAANQTNGSQKAQQVDGSGNVQPAGDTPGHSVNVEVTDGTNVLGTAAHPVRTDPTGTTPQPVTNSGLSNLDVALSTRTKPADQQHAIIDSGTVSANLNAGTNLIGQVSSSNETNTVYNGTTALTPKFKAITASSSGATTIVAAVTSKKIRVLKWDLVANAAVNAKWQSHVTPTDLTGLYYLAQNGGVVSGYCPQGHFETVAGEALDINLSGSVAVGGVLTYVEV